MGITRAVLAVDYVASPLWITGLTALWITRAVLAVDYVASPLWISQPFVLGRICPHLSVLWRSGLEQGGGGAALPVGW